MNQIEACGQNSVVKLLKGENRGKSQFSLVKHDDGTLKAKWKSSYEDVAPQRTTYANNAVECIWRVDHLVHGKRGET